VRYVLVLGLLLQIYPGGTKPKGPGRTNPPTGVVTPVTLDCPCFTEASITAKHEATCTEPNRLASCSTGGAVESVIIGCNPGAVTVGIYLGADAGSPGPQCQRDEESPNNDLTVDPITAQQRADCGTELLNWETNNPSLCP
jgi:hypothetical protein